MGLFARYRARTRTKVDAARQEAEDTARSRGADPDDVRTGGEQAARRKRRRIHATGYGGTS